MFVSVTRLRLRSIRFLPGFIWYASGSTKQAKRASGCFGVRTRKTRGFTFWTLSLWKDEASMRAFRGAQPHGTAMPKLALWCDESAVAHWEQDSPEWPSWDEATEELSKRGRLSPVHRPSPDHAAGQIGVS